LTVKDISITDEAYNALLREKRENESFTQTILRLAGKTGKLSDCFGGWKMADDEEALTTTELRDGWGRTHERIASEMP
jgi:predicted CopG family antitoxin